VAFDTGMLTVNGGLRIHLARPLADAIQTDPLARQYYGRPPLREALLLQKAPRPLPANTSTGTVRRSSSPDPAHDCRRPARPARHADECEFRLGNINVLRAGAN